MNLAFIPLLAAYGLRVCPVLSIPGFGFGCYYAGTYVGLLMLMNTISIQCYLRPGAFGSALRRHPATILIFTYIVASFGALAVLNLMLGQNHLSSQSRAPQILFLSSALLAITQFYGLNWALHGKFLNQGSVVSNSVLWKNWLQHGSRIVIPLLAVVAVLLHFLLGQSLTFNDGRTAPTVSNDQLIQHTSLAVLFLFLWLWATFLFHFLAERDQVESVEKHFRHLSTSSGSESFVYQTSVANSWGLWRTIATYLNDFSKAKQEKSKLVDAFSKFVSVGVAQDVLTTESLSTGEIAKSGITQEMTVIMVDIRGFTSLSEALDPVQVVELLNEYFKSMLSVVSSMKVTIDKFIGDGILAYVDFNGSKIDENRESVRAALSMLSEVKFLNIELSKKNLPAVQIGVGLYRGPLIIGLIGTDQKMQHTIIGDTVNRAARLEGLCKDLGVSIVMSSWVWHSLDSETQKLFGTFGLRTVKGIAEPMEIFGGPVFGTS